MTAGAKDMFAKAAFIQLLGIQLTDVGEGFCETTMDIRPDLTQQHGFIHAGAVTTLADHTAGGAAATVVANPEKMLSIELKSNFLRPAIGEMLRCRATVLKAGRTIVVAESEVYAQTKEGKEKLIAKTTVTMMVVQ